MRKQRFCDKDHGLTPLQNVDSLEFIRTFLFWSKKHSFLSRISKTLSFWLFLVKKTYKKKVDFLTKTITPLQNVDFLDFARTSLSRAKKHSLLSRI